MSAAKTKAESIIAEHEVVIFSKSYCPYCKAAKKTLKEAGAEAFVVELDQVGTYFVQLSLGNNPLLEQDANQNDRRWK